ncbi:hypothetical protein AVEN_70504-1, partial [Araneus ventricosus]
MTKKSFQHPAFDIRLGVETTIHQIFIPSPLPQGSGVYGSLWEKDRIFRRNCETSPSGTVAELLSAQCRRRASVVMVQSSSYCQLFKHLKKFQAKHHFPSDDDVQTAVTGCLRSPVANLFETVYRNRCHGMTGSSIPMVLMLR